MNAHAPRPKVDLDAYYASRPKPRELFYWPVFDDPFFGHRPIAWFDTYGEAVSFVNESVGKREFYIGEPRYRLTEVSGDPLKGLVA